MPYLGEHKFRQSLVYHDDFDIAIDEVFVGCLISWLVVSAMIIILWKKVICLCMANYVLLVHSGKK